MSEGGVQISELMGVNEMAATIATEAPVRATKPWYKILYLQVLIAILLGVLVGWLWPNVATNDWIKALGDGFIKLIKMVIAPIIFCTVVSGISHIDDARKVGRVGIKALVYFEIVSSFALILGLVMGNLFHVGHGLAAKPDAAAVQHFAEQAASSSTSSRTALSARWRAATSCRCCCLPSCSGFR